MIKRTLITLGVLGFALPASAQSDCTSQTITIQCESTCAPPPDTQLTQEELQALLDGCKGACTIPPNTYSLTAPLTLRNKRVRIQAYGAEFEFPDGVDGLIVDRSAEGAVIEGGVFRGASNSTASVGLTVRAGVALRDVTVGGFGRGVVIACGDGFGDAHCNMWYAENVTTSGNMLDGWYTRGSDANAGVAVRVNSFTNCARASSLYDEPSAGIGKDEQTCANFNEGTFLGNTYIGPHSAFSLDRATDERFLQYWAPGANGRNVFIGAYAESGTWGSGNGPSKVMGYGHHVYGGLNNIEVSGGALRFSERATVNQLTFFGYDPVIWPKASICFGLCDTTGSPFVAVFGGRLLDLTSKMELRMVPYGDGRWELEYGRPSRRFLFRLDMTGSPNGDPSWLDLLQNPHPWEDR